MASLNVKRWTTPGSSTSAIVAARHLIALVDLVLKDFQLLDQDRGLDGVEPRIQPDMDMLIAIAALPVHAQAKKQVFQCIVIGETGAAIAITTKRLGGEETGGRGLAAGASGAGGGL